MVPPHRPPVPLGQVAITPAAAAALTKPAAWWRHSAGDWGEVDADDWKANDDSLKYGTRLLSAYTSAAGIAYWVTTEADRTATTLLLPYDY